MRESTPETPTPVPGVPRRRGRPPKDKSNLSAATPAPEVDDDDGDDKPASGRVPAAKRAKDEDDYSPWVDILRVLTFLLLASTGLSYLISGGESFTWGQKHMPRYLTYNYWKTQLEGPRYMTLEELAAYDGTDPKKPIYLAINGTIYDVTPGARIYGPGGSYHVFAGVDASRGYVTGCFAEDRTADMRGVEEMYLPLDDYDVDRRYTADQLRALRKQEAADAKQKAFDALKHWVDFFAKSKKYHFVGYVRREKDWLKKTKRRKLCEQAQQGRVKRSLPEEQDGAGKS